VTEFQEADKRLELAYDAAMKRLAMQDNTFGNVRTRANNLLATAALFTSFSSGVGLINTDPKKTAVLSPCIATVLLVVVLLLGSCVLFVLLPAKGWIYGPSAQKIMDMRDKKMMDEGAIRTEVITRMIEGIDLNNKKLDARLWAFRAAALLLVVEIGILAAHLTVWGRA
jgi:hypothetical protein